jgi:hypothetical protein
LQGASTESLHIEIIVFDTVSFQNNLISIQQESYKENLIQKTALNNNQLYFDVNIPFQLTKVYLAQAQE